MNDPKQQEKSSSFADKLIFPVIILICIFILLIWFEALAKESNSTNFYYVINELRNIFVKIVAFMAMVVAFGYFYQHDISETIKKGFIGIGNIIGNEMQKVGKAAASVQNYIDGQSPLAKAQISDYDASGNQNDIDITTREDIQNTEKLASEFAQKGESEKIRNQWLDLLKKYPKNIAIVEKAVNFYENNEFLREEEKKELLKIVVSAEDNFKTNPLYYKYLSISYLYLHNLNDDAKEKAIEASEKSISLDPNNPKWHRALGYVHYWLKEIDKAIFYTEKALSIKGGNEEEIYETKNNLAFYYAMKKINKEEALEYATESLEYFKKHTDNKLKAMHFDTLGYVQLRFGETKNDFEHSLANFRTASELDPYENAYFAHQQEALKAISYTINNP